MRLFKQNLSADSIVCCSGGVDSICAAHILHKSMGIHNLYHFNHGTPQADAMQEAVERFAKDFQMNLVVRRANKFLDTEQDFRTERFAYITQQKHKVFVMGHNLDEATESYVMRFLTGNPHYLPIPVTSEFGTNLVVHPFLLIDKAQFRVYAKSKNLEKYIVEDSSNHDASSGRRAWIRNTMLPMLQDQQINLKTTVRKKYLTEYELEKQERHG